MHFLNIGVKKFKIIEHRFPIWIKQFCKFSFCMSYGIIQYASAIILGLWVHSFTIESRSNSSLGVVFWEEYSRAIIH